jgi:cytochrome c peroxidase
MLARASLRALLVTGFILAMPWRSTSVDAADTTRLRGLDLYRPVPDDNPLTPSRVDLGRSYFWDGRAATLEDQVLQPIVHADELAMSPAGIIALARSERYRNRFVRAFGGAGSPPVVSGFSRTTVITGRSIDPYAGLSGDDAATMHQVAFALAAYVRTIQAGDSPTIGTSPVSERRSALRHSAA